MGTAREAARANEYTASGGRRLQDNAIFSARTAIFAQAPLIALGANTNFTGTKSEKCIDNYNTCYQLGGKFYD
ncbi:hypothetical protein [Nostoc sp. 'Peltigera membranacea cyanobiont' 210A]|uniref:hypothetical protein n=1 Tax=Nostoc sp. 'Peltigera membranacea cyanobiont' 210A TaxID=2014529 RepID=UPI001CB9AF69|nr:hypothetical protein [Nostoc sp. 'Peltigera membranacea cyanobiont' 210A]